MLSKNDYKKICIQLKLFGFRNYKEFINSSLWKEFRNTLYKMNPPAECSVCKKGSQYFHLHHVTYKRLLDPKLVKWVCDECHKRVHEDIKNTIQDNTNELIIEINGDKFERRKNSLRIIPSSGLPAVLHHSMHASGVFKRIEEGNNPGEEVNNYIRKKQEKGDSLIIGLVDEYTDKIYEYIWKEYRPFTTN